MNVPLWFGLLNDIEDRRRGRPWVCAFAQRSAILVMAYQGATVSAERTAST
jgi:hypothetical protein